jgi:uncharacterized metal-binding protein YceD (DUF177 family)
MKLDVKNLQAAPFGQNETLTIELFNEPIDEDVLAERTRGELKLTRLEDSIMGQFKGTSKVMILCDRCLSEYREDIVLDFSQEYMLDRREDDPEKMIVDRYFEIDIKEPIRQEILAHIPVKKLCQKECEGLCTACGNNLNVEKCKCKKVTSEKSPIRKVVKKEK